MHTQLSKVGVEAALKGFWSPSVLSLLCRLLAGKLWIRRDRVVTRGPNPADRHCQSAPLPTELPILAYMPIGVATVNIGPHGDWMQSCHNPPHLPDLRQTANFTNRIIYGFGVTTGIQIGSSSIKHERCWPTVTANSPRGQKSIDDIIILYDQHDSCVRVQSTLYEKLALFCSAGKTLQDKTSRPEQENEREIVLGCVRGKFSKRSPNQA